MKQKETDVLIVGGISFAPRFNATRAVRRDRKHLTDFQSLLRRRGVELEWCEDLNLADGDPRRHAN